MSERAAPFSSPEDIFSLEHTRTRADLKLSKDILRKSITGLERPSSQKDAYRILICKNAPQFKKICPLIFEKRRRHFAHLMAANSGQFGTNQHQEIMKNMVIPLISVDAIVFVIFRTVSEIGVCHLIINSSPESSNHILAILCISEFRKTLKNRPAATNATSNSMAASPLM
jgi:hypothetical protein